MKRRALLVAAVLTAGCQTGSETASSANQMAPAPTAANAPDADRPKPVIKQPIAPAPTNLKSDEENYVEDISRICNVMALSGAAGVPEDERIVPMAQWLGANIVTQKAKDFMITTNQIGDPLKHAEALDAEAKVVGLEGCALSAEWRK